MKMLGEKMDFLDLLGLVVMILFILSVVLLYGGAAGESKAVKKYETEIKELRLQIETARTQINQARDILRDKYWDEVKDEPLSVESYIKIKSEANHQKD